MHAARSKIAVAAIATTMALASHVALEGVDVRVDYDKAFDFRPMRTWAWNPEGPGEVMMARTQDDDPAAMKAKAEPWILDAAQTEMTRRGLQKAATAPDLTLTYYLLLTTNMTAQTGGQFLPATAAWALPAFPQATQSLKMMNQGSLVLDVRAKGIVVWRGVAQARVAFESDDKKREALVREGVRDLLKRFPPKQ